MSTPFMTEERPIKIAAGALPAGTPAPAFTLPNAAAEPVSLSDYAGQPLILVFYPGDWTPVCGDQLSLYNEVLPLFEEYDAALLGISVDSRWSHRAFAESRNLSFPLLSDFEPKGEVARRYGVYRQDGRAERALFVVDTDGSIRWSSVSPINVNPGADGILRALNEL